MNAPDASLLADVQSIADHRNIPIQRVGVRAIKHPIIVATPNGPQPTIAEIDMAVFLPSDVKGTHMSRFLEVLQNHGDAIDFSTMHLMMESMLERLESTGGSIKMSFPYFVRKTAPISGVQSLLDYQVTFEAEAHAHLTEIWLTVVTPVTSLCPCSKKISAYGAHNQRSHITLKVMLDGPLEIEQLITIAEQSASCELYGLLKRPDEKFVTERAYENPKFVEDLVRDLALALNKERRVSKYRIDCENFESIHNHSAVAWLEFDKRKLNTSD
jgi:GTP cyclohydrolase I